MNPALRRLTLPLLLLSLFTTSSAFAAGDPMRLVGSLLPWEEGQFGAVVVDANRNVAYVGSLNPFRGVAVINMTDRANPVVVDELPSPTAGDFNALTTSYDVDLVGRYLLVSHHNDLLAGFHGVSVFDTSPDPFHPVLLRRIATPAICGLESAELDPEVESGRPYAYCNAHCFFDGGVYIVNILTGNPVGFFAPPEPQPCPPFPCPQENLPHEGFVQRHPVSHKMLMYVGFWDSGLRIVDVTDPANPTEVGAFDYGPGTPYRKAHGAVATPSGNWTYVADEEASDTTGVVHIFDTSACDGSSHCTPSLVGQWHVGGHGSQDPAERGGPGYIRFDPHNMTPRGENTLLLGNYGLGIRLVDTSDKTDPEQISFYMPNQSSNGDQQRPQFYIGRRTWIALFGSDGLVYASDINSGLFICELNPHTTLPQGAARFTGGGTDAATGASFRATATAGGAHAVTFTTKRDGPVSLAIFDAAGRRIALVTRAYAPAGTHTMVWNGTSSTGRAVPSGLYFARLATAEGQSTGKVVHLAP